MSKNIINIDKEFYRLLNSSGIYNRNDIAWYTKFNRFGCVDPYNVVSTTREYLFFTKPNLHLFRGKDSNSGLNREIESYPIFIEGNKNYKDVMEQLCFAVSTKQPFIKVLTNSVKNNLDLPAITSKEMDTPATIYGSKIFYNSSSESSDEDIEFSLEFEDTKYLEIYMLFKIWDEYTRYKSLGVITPPDDGYTLEKVLHDQIAIYKFIVGDDGETILHYSKLFGVFPKGVPREAFSDSTRSGGLIYSVPFKASFVEDMNPIILREFNNTVAPAIRGLRDMPLYSNKLRAPNGDWVNCPYVYAKPIKKIKSFDPRENSYVLRWR